ncbi:MULTISPECIES: penicillin-binding protein [Actinomadura]|uniref:Membrane carboxypeptidase (Penicillin-binding protein) n=1 Tax=Actinomadura madurae TaxID=1993 RepID=A0A1I5VB83_9ACTN|nr:transglycosylase domain-containing protein [Actinomadura madurae]SFQ04607.1 Membrane carboxypeptidase (penicillin-binding protein) [Actinomadura madurae]SPT60516.1 Penicillin-binding protein 4 precursor [Actinomadura madurae]
MRVAKSDRVKAASTLFRLLGAGVVAGLIVALIALPAVGSAGLTARDAANNFEDMEGELKTTPPSEKTVMYDASGKQVATFFDKYRESVRLDQVDPIMRKAIIDIEDSRFYEHGALDLKGTIRALASNVESEQTQGGSTLTQQYVKNLLVDSARTQEEYREATAPTVGRKLRELRYALDIEQRMTKDQILEGYLNIAYFGAGAYGVQAAAKRYFSVPASKLNLGQAALLAGITQNPAAFDPIRNPKDARHRRDIVLYRMAQLGHISKAQADEEAAKPIELNRTDPVGGCQSSKAPYFCEYVKYDMLNILSDGKYWELEPKQQQAVVNELNRGGYTIRTTLDMDDQRAVDKTLRQTVAPGGNRVGAEAMVEPGTGKVKAIGLSKRFGPGKGRTTINLPADSRHGGGNGVSAGSTFKIFTLAAAIDQGIPVSTTINSPQTTTIGGFQPCRYTGMYQGKKVKNAMIGGGTWTLSNAGDSEKGNFNLKTGTWHSVNTFYAHLEKRVGVCNAVKMAEKFGMKQGNGNPLLPIASQVLGVNDIDMVHLAAAYAGFAARGKYCAPISVTEVVDPEGKKLKLPKQDCHQALDEDVADKVNSILQGVLTKGTAAGRGIGRPAAGKTGTCEEFTCAVFAGFTPNLAAATAYWDFRGPWQYKVYGVYGADIPGGIWQQSMRSALAGEPAPGFRTPSRDFGDTTRVPEVKGDTIGAATAKLRGADLKVKVAPGSVDSDQPRGTVVSTSPDGGTEVPPGSTVILYVSSGKKGNGRGQPNGRSSPWED